MRQSSAFNGFSLLDEPRNLFQKSDSNDSAPDKEVPNLDLENSAPDKDVPSNFDDDDRESKQIKNHIRRISSRSKQVKDDEFNKKQS